MPTSGIPVKYSNFSMTYPPPVLRILPASSATSLRPLTPPHPALSPDGGEGLDGGEEAGGRSLGPRDLVEGRGEVHAAAGQRDEIGQALHDDHAGAQDHPVHGEVLRGEVGQARAVFLEEVEADVLGPAVHQPLRGLWGEVRRLG